MFVLQNKTVDSFFKNNRVPQVQLLLGEKYVSLQLSFHSGDMLQQSEWPWQWRALLLLQTSTHSNCLVHWTICWEQTQVVQHCFNFSKIGLHREVSGRAFMSEAMSTVLQGRPIHWFLPDQAILRVFFRSSRASSSSGNFPSVQKKNPLMRHRDCPSMEKQGVFLVATVGWRAQNQ